MEVGQVQRPPLRFGQHLEGRADLAGGVRPEHRLGNVGHVTRVPCDPRLAAPVRFLPADRVDRTAVGERPEEAAQGPAARVDALRMLPQGHEHLLGDVLGGLRVDERPHGEPVDEAGVAVVEVDEGRLIAAGQALDQNPLRPPGLMPFVHEASPLHRHRSKPSAGADHTIRVRTELTTRPHISPQERIVRACDGGVGGRRTITTGRRSRSPIRTVPSAVRTQQ